MNVKMNDIDNSKLEEAVKLYLQEPGKESLLKLAVMLKDASLFVPARVMQKNQGFQPYVVKNEQGDMFMPAFTSIAKFPETKEYQGMLKIPYKQCESLLLDQPTLIQGIALNPSTDSLMLKTQMLKLTRDIEKKQKEQKAQKPKRVTMKTQDFHMVMRHNVEFHVLPKKIFEGKKEFIEQITEETLLDIYKIPYVDANQEANFPYTKKDFELMQLNIKEDLNLIQIVAPEKRLAKTNCREIYIVWNPQTDKIAYYMIEKGIDPANGAYLLDRVKEDDTWEKISEAPEEGSVMSHIMELFEQLND